MLKIWNCLIVFLFLCSCDGRNYIDPKNIQILAEHKMNFPKESTDHFPQQLGSEVDIIYNEGIENNNLNLYLVEHNVSEKDINKLLNRLKDTKYYRGGNKNLLIINRNEKIIEGFSEFPKIDSVNLQGDAPVPNFIRYKNGIPADPNYEFYIIHTDNNERQFKNEILGENESMPFNWKHGITYGVAVNKLEKDIIYWVAVW